MAAEQAGELRIRFSDYAENNISPVVHSWSEAMVSQGTATPVGVQISALPTMPYVSAQGHRLIMEFVIASSATLATNAYQIPVNLINEKTGEIQPRNLVAANFTLVSTPACVTATPARLGYYDAPYGFRIQLAAGRPYHAYITT